MNILYITHENQLNGASKSLLNIIDNIDQKKNHIYVVLSADNGRLNEELAKRKVRTLILPYYRWCEINTNWKYWAYVNLRWVLFGRLRNQKTAKTIADFVNKHHIDIVHVNSSVVGLAVDIKKYSSVKIAWHLREFADLDFDMYPLKPIKGYYQLMNSSADVFICNSNAVKQHYKEIDESKKIVLHNFVDDKNLVQHDYSDHKVVNFLISGRLSQAKGQDEAIRACEILFQKNITNFKLYMAGSGEIGVPSKLKDRVVLLGQVEDMPALRKRMDVELVCSRAEAFGRVTVEAMLGGIPVIGSNTGGTPELIQDGKNGYLYKYGNPEELESKMEIFIANPDLIKTMGLYAQEYARSRFLSDVYMKKLWQIYNGLLSTAGSEK